MARASTPLPPLPAPSKILPARPPPPRPSSPPHPSTPPPLDHSAREHLRQLLLQLLQNASLHTPLTVFPGISTPPQQPSSAFSSISSAMSASSSSSVYASPPSPASYPPPGTHLDWADALLNAALDLAEYVRERVPDVARSRKAEGRAERIARCLGAGTIGDGERRESKDTVKEEIKPSRPRKRDMALKLLEAFSPATSPAASPAESPSTPAEQSSASESDKTPKPSPAPSTSPRLTRLVLSLSVFEHQPAPRSVVFIPDAHASLARHASTAIPHGRPLFGGGAEDTEGEDVKRVGGTFLVGGAKGKEAERVAKVLEILVFSVLSLLLEQSLMSDSHVPPPSSPSHSPTPSIASEDHDSFEVLSPSSPGDLSSSAHAAHRKHHRKRSVNSLFRSTLDKLASWSRQRPSSPPPPGAPAPPPKDGSGPSSPFAGPATPPLFAEPDRFARVARQMQALLLSTSPSVRAFPAPALVLRLQDEEARAHAAGAGARRKVDSRRVSMDAFALKVGYAQARRAAQIGVAAGAGAAGEDGGGDEEKGKARNKIASDVKAGLASLMTHNSSLGGFLRHQSLPVLFEYSGAASPFPATPPRVIQLPYYTRADPTLGQKIEDLADLRPGASESWTHANWRVTAHVVALESAEEAGNEEEAEKEKERLPEAVEAALGMGKWAGGKEEGIDMWVECRECGERSEPAWMADGTYLYSFGKSLELLLYSNRFIPSALCPHAATALAFPTRRTDIVRVFRTRSRMVRFELDELAPAPFELRGPKVQLDPNVSDADAEHEGERDHRCSEAELVDHETAEKLVRDMKREIAAFFMVEARAGLSQLHTDYVEASAKASGTNRDSLALSVSSTASAASSAADSTPSPPPPPESSKEARLALVPCSRPLPPTPEAASLNRLKRAFNEEELALFDLLERTQPSRINDVRRALAESARACRARIDGWRAKHLPKPKGEREKEREKEKEKEKKEREKEEAPETPRKPISPGVQSGPAQKMAEAMKEAARKRKQMEDEERRKAEHTIPEYLTNDRVHAYPGSSILVREDEPSSIIAFALSSVDYYNELANMKKPPEPPTASPPTIESPSESGEPTLTPIPEPSTLAASTASRTTLDGRSTPDPEANEGAFHPEPWTSTISRKEDPADASSGLLSLRVLSTKRSIDGFGVLRLRTPSRPVSMLEPGDTNGTGSKRSSMRLEPGSTMEIRDDDAFLAELMASERPDSPTSEERSNASPASVKTLTPSHISSPSGSSNPPASPTRSSATDSPTRPPPLHRRISELSTLSGLSQGSVADANITHGRTATIESDRTIGPRIVEENEDAVEDDDEEEIAPELPPKDMPVRPSLTSRASDSLSSFLTFGRKTLPPASESDPGTPIAERPSPLEDAPVEDSPHVRYDFGGRKIKISCTIYYAEKFDALRRRCGVDKDYVNSLARSTPWNAEGGKTKASFFKTADDRFVIKQLTSSWTVDDKHALLEWAPAYFKYMDEDKPTLLCKILGFYSLKIANTESKAPPTRMDVLIMENLFFEQSISRVFDLKGIEGRKVKSGSTLGDADWEDPQYKRLHVLQPHAKNVIRAAINSDTTFLAEQNIMDYSLLVGIDEKKKELVIGIIDAIGAYTLAKLLESAGKHSKQALFNPSQSARASKVTVLPPAEYQKRFVDAIECYFVASPDKWTRADDSDPAPSKDIRLPSPL